MRLDSVSSSGETHVFYDSLPLHHSAVKNPFSFQLLGLVGDAHASLKLHCRFHIQVLIFNQIYFLLNSPLMPTLFRTYASVCISVPLVL